MLRNKSRRAVSLTELLVVLVIAGVLAGLLLPAFQRVRSAAARTTCRENMRQLGVAFHSFENINRHLPPGIRVVQTGQLPRGTFLTLLLPFIEQPFVWDRAQKHLRSSLPLIDHPGLATVINIYQCPSDPRSGRPHETHYDYKVATTSYVGVCGTDYLSRDGVLFQGSAVKLAEIRDGLSNTLMLGERPPSADLWYGWWYFGAGQEAAGVPSGSPDMLLGAREKNNEARFAGHCPPGPYEFGPGRLDLQCSVFHFWSPHPGGANFLLADGAVRFVSYGGGEVLAAMATRDNGEVIGDW